MYISMNWLGNPPEYFEENEQEIIDYLNAMHANDPPEGNKNNGTVRNHGDPTEPDPTD